MRLPIPPLRSLLRRDDGDAVAPAVALPPLLGRRDGDLEVPHLSRYIGVVALVTACAMLSAWSRIDLIETSAALGSAESRLETARAENARLTLERAALTDPARLGAASDALGLQGDVPVVVLPAASR